MIKIIFSFENFCLLLLIAVDIIKLMSIMLKSPGIRFLSFLIPFGAESNMTTTKKELNEAISQNQGAPQIIVKQITQLFLDFCIDELAKGNRLEFRDFGIFSTFQRKKKIGRNPKTGEPVEVPPKRVVRFKAGRLLKQKVK